MTPEFPASATKTFNFSFPACTNENVFFNLEVPVQIPHDGCTRELVQRVISMFHIPVYLETELNEALAKFVSEETKSFHNERDEALLNQLKNNEINVDDIVKNWEKEIKDNVMEYAEQKGTSDEEVFAMAYHKLVHSPALETILQVESSYSNTVAETLKNQDDEIKSLTLRQTEEMEEKIAQLNTFATEEDINELASRHFEEQSLLAGRWGSQLDALWQTQRAQYRAWLMTTLDEYQGSSELNTPSNSPLGVFSSPPPRLPAPPAPRLEESFTIHLGSQLKQTHNLRIVAMDLLELCRTDNPLEPSSRLQTALGLYSAELSAVVLLAEPGRPGPAPRVGRGAEYHFSAVDAQLSVIGDLLKEPLEQRSARTTAAASPGAAPRRRGALQPGDIYVTRHSALADAHLLFHLVKDKTVRSGDINSRHPVILGLRNILKTACCNDVTHISLPLLLTHELTDEMTAAWCLRRAELVLKCVKGFMLETAAWGGAELRSVQLAAPAGLAREVFLSLAALLPSVFRTPNPLKFNKGS